MKKSLFGLNENIVSTAAYFGTFVTGVIILIFERENQNVRFHALQSLVYFLPLQLVTWLFTRFFGWIPLFGGIVSTLLSLLIVISWLFLMFSAFQGKQFRIPIIGDAVAAQIYS